MTCDGLRMATRPTGRRHMTFNHDHTPSHLALSVPPTCNRVCCTPTPPLPLVVGSTSLINVSNCPVSNDPRCTHMIYSRQIHILDKSFERRQTRLHLVSTPYAATADE